MSPERRVGNVDIWLHTSSSGWRSTNVRIGISQQEALEYSRRMPTAVSLIVWHWTHLPSMPVFYYRGAELLSSQVIDMQELEDEVRRLRTVVQRGQTSREPDQQIESVAAEVLLEAAEKKRDEFLDSLKKEKT